MNVKLKWPEDRPRFCILGYFRYGYVDGLTNVQMYLPIINNALWLVRLGSRILPRNPHQVSPQALCSVKRLICDLQELLPIGGVGRSRCSADAGRNRQLLAAHPA